MKAIHNGKVKGKKYDVNVVNNANIQNESNSQLESRVLTFHY